MNEDMLSYLRKNVEASLNAVRPTAAQAFSDIIVKPPPVSPQEQFNQFMNTPQEQQLAEASQDPEAYQQKIDDMLTIGEQLMGPQAQQLRPYFESVLQQVPPPIVNPVDQQYSLVDQALAESWNPGEEDAATNPD